MSKVPKFSWVREVLHRFAPEADLSKGFDVNNNGLIDKKEELKDVNHNGVLGDPEDWLDFLRRNPELREPSSAVDLFKLGARFKPTNPLHDRLLIEAEMVPQEEIEKAYDAVEDILNDVNSALQKKEKWEPKEKLELVYRVMKDRGIKFQTRSEDQLFTNNIVNNLLLDCDTCGDVVLAIAHEKGWPVSLVYLANHIIVRWDDGETPFNMEFGEIHSDQYYRDKFSLDPSTVQNGVYLRELNRDEMDGLYLETRAFTKHVRKDYWGAIKDYDWAIGLYPKFVVAYNSRGLARRALGDSQGASDDFNEAIRLDPKSSEGYVGLGCLEGDRHHYWAAKEAFDKALALKPANAWALYNRGLAKIYLRDQRGAAEDLRKAATNPSVKASAEEALKKLSSK